MKHHNILRIILLTFIVITCIIAIAAGIYIQFFYKYSETDKFMLGKVDREMANQEMYTNLKNNFSKIFNNSATITKTVVPYLKQEPEKNIIYNQKNIEKMERQYNVDVNIPFINIKSDVVNQINEEIASIFETKLKTIKSGVEVYTIYNVSYTAYVNVNTISLAIKATLKEGNSVQRVILQTYNYDMEADKLLKLSNVIEQSNLSLNTLQEKINKEIVTIDKKNQELEQAGYSVFKRNTQDEIYKVENSNDFLLSSDGYLYIIYAYGNNNLTSEMDLIII